MVSLDMLFFIFYHVILERKTSTRKRTGNNIMSSCDVNYDNTVSDDTGDVAISSMNKVNVIRMHCRVFSGASNLQ